jgi:type II secretion system protein H
MVSNRHLGMDVKSKSAGFTLIELLVVVVIIVLVTSVGLSQGAKHIDSIRLEQGARELAATLRLLQNRAIVEERSFLIRMVGSNYKWGYLIRKIREDGFFDDEQTYKSLPPGIKVEYFSGTTKELYLHSTGAPSRGATIRLANMRGQAMTLTIVPATGRVQIKGEATP